MLRLAPSLRPMACALFLLAWGPPARAAEDVNTIRDLMAFFKTMPKPAVTDPVIPEKKMALILRMALGAPSVSRSAFLVYYNSTDSRAGFSHGALWMDGRVYETFPHPKPGETFYRVSSIPEALQHQRAEYGFKQAVLPTAILEIPNLTKIQKKAIVKSIMSIKRYSFFNGGGGSSEQANCMGIHYEALRAANLPLPPLKSWQVLPLAMGRLVARHVPGAKLTGNLHGWVRSNQLPRFGRTTLRAVRGLSADTLARIRQNREGRQARPKKRWQRTR